MNCRNLQVACALVFVTSCLVQDVTAQVDMFNGTVDNVCGQLFRDDGGTGNYSGAQLEMTICPDTPGDFVSAYFVAFNIFGSAIPNQSSQLAIFDGNSTAATSLGSYTGNDLQGLTVWSTPNNTSGCLTFVFTPSNDDPLNLAGWEAEISCGTPCAPPTAAANFVAAPSEILDINNTPTLQICTGTSITVEDNGSFVDGFPIEQWVWDFGDGFVETLTSGNATTHTFNNPGAYTVALTVGYDNGTDLCTSLNIDPLQVFVSTPPIFNTLVESPICAGSTTVDLALDGSPVISELWTDAPDFDAPSISPTGFDAGFTYCSQLEFDFFPAGATLDECTDLVSVVASMEHSYLGDLDINVTCPDGTTVVLQTQGGGGTFLGEPVDVENDLTEGLCYEYGWSETSTLGQIEDPANSSVVNYTNTLGNAVSGTIVNPGIYEPENTLCDLVGCPLNGTWEFCFTDLLGADNGFVCTWNLNIDPNLLPGVTVIQPEIVVAEWDFSAYADGSELIITPSNTVDLGLDVEAVTPGFYPLSFHVENDFGCTADTTVVLEVIDNPGSSLTVGADQVWCNLGSPIQLDASVNSGPVSPACGAESGTFDYCYMNAETASFTYCPDNPGDGTGMVLEFLQGELENGWDFVTVYDGPDNTAPVLGNFTGNAAGQTFSACNTDGCITFEISSDPGSGSCADGGFQPLEWEVSCDVTGSQCGYDWEWSPAQYLDNPFVPSPSVIDFGVAPVEFTVLVEPVGFDNCAASATVLVEPAFSFEASNQQPTCLENDGVLQVELLTAVSDAQGPFSAVFQLQDEVTGNWDTIQDTTWTTNGTVGLYDLVPGTYSLTVQNDNGCFYVETFTMNESEDLLLNVPPTQQMCIGGELLLEVDSDQDENFTWTYVWDNGLPNGPVVQVTPSQTTQYNVQAFDVNGCPTDSYPILVNVYPALNADLVAPPLLCSGEEANLDATASNGGSSAGYEYTWSFEGNVLNENEESVWVIPPSSGEYCVTVTDDCETPPSTACAEVVLESPVPIFFSVDTMNACGSGTFVFSNDTDPSLISNNLWAFGDDTYSAEFNTVKEFEQAGFYNVSLTVTSIEGGCEYTRVEEGFINVFPIPEVGYIANPQPTRAPDTEIHFQGSSNADVVEWYWTFNTFDPLGYDTVQNPTFEFPIMEGGIYPVQLQITDSHGCVNVVNRNIEIQGMFNLFIPTSFTPNNDGHNDAFFVQGTDIDPDNFVFEIWNRWGELVWKTNDPTDAWYGQVDEDGQHYVPNGPYPYRVEVVSLEDETVTKEVYGVVTLIR